MNVDLLNKIKCYTLINIRVSTIILAACYVHTMRNGSWIYSELSTEIIFFVFLSLIVIIVSIILLLAVIIKNKIIKTINKV